MFAYVFLPCTGHPPYQTVVVFPGSNVIYARSSRELPPMRYLGFLTKSDRAVVDPFNFDPQVKIPVLMVNGRYDFFYPKETTQDPMFRLLGTPEKDKRHVVFESGHVPPPELLIKEVLDWLDHYLGPAQ